MTEYTRPESWTPRPEEHIDVTMLRIQVAEEERAWLQLWINDATIPDVDLLAAFARISYNNARKIVNLTLNVECHCGELTGWVCPRCQAQAVKDVADELQQG